VSDGAPAAAPSQERVAFDKAEEAESLEGLRIRYREPGEEIDGLHGELKETAKGSTERADLEGRLSRLDKRKERLAELISRREETVDGE
jgi:hypothetical protein